MPAATYSLTLRDSTTASTSAPIKMARPDRYNQKMRIATPAVVIASSGRSWDDHC